jgi:hypothetical protein
MREVQDAIPHACRTRLGMPKVCSPQVGCFSTRSTSEGRARARSGNPHEAASQAREPQSGIIFLLHQPRDSDHRSRQILFSFFSTLTTIYMTIAIYMFCTRGSPCLSIQLDFITWSLLPISVMSFNTNLWHLARLLASDLQPTQSYNWPPFLHFLAIILFIPHEGSPKLQHRPSTSASPGGYAYHEPRIPAWISGPKQKSTDRTESMAG